MTVSIGILIIFHYQKDWTLMKIKNSANLNGTDSAKVNQFSCKGSITFSDRLSFCVQIEKKQTQFSVTKLNTVHTGVLTNQIIMTGLPVLQLRGQDIEMIKNISLTKIAGR